MLKILEKSIKIKQKRKVQYPLKRINYRRYKNANWSWKDIFIEIDNKIGYLHPDIIRKLE